MDILLRAIGVRPRRLSELVGSAVKWAWRVTAYEDTG